MSADVDPGKTQNAPEKFEAEMRAMTAEQERDRFGLALRMIANGCANPREFAAETLAKATPR